MPEDSPAGDAFARIATLSDERIDLAEAALAIARDEYPDLDAPAYLRRLDDLAAGARGFAANRSSPAEAIEGLNRYLFAECGFRGNEEDYYDPRNSFLNEVLDRRTGIPITLALVYAEVARRVGIPVVGVGFPGHFLVKHPGPPEVLVDPFSGRALTREQCTERLGGGASEGAGDLFRAARPREILVRMLRNLKHAWARRNELTRALAATGRILLLLPDRPEELRDRGMLYLRLECFSAALRDFERYLDLAPDGESAARIRAALPGLRAEAKRLQ